MYLRGNHRKKKLLKQFQNLILLILLDRNLTSILSLETTPSLQVLSPINFVFFAGICSLDKFPVFLAWVIELGTVTERV
jgi:hypothetical protein